MALSIPTPDPDSGSGRRSRRNVWLVVAVVTVLVAVPLLMAAGASFWERSSHDDTKPRWVTPAVIHATTGDGMVVKAQVSLDIADPDARSEVQGHMEQIGLLLQASFVGRTKRDLAAEGGLEALTDDMREKLNDYLGADAAEGVRSVVVADILYSQP